MKKEIFILCSEPPEQLGGVEACVREQARGFEKCGYDVRVFHRKNSGPMWFRRNDRRISHHLTDTLLGFFIGRTAQKAMHSNVAAVFSHSTVGWYPLRVPPDCKQFHIYHGTYRGQANAIRKFISYLGYLKLTWWDSMVLERMSGRGKQIFVVSSFVRTEVKRLFGYESVTIGNPLDLGDFHPLDQQQCRRELGLPADAIIGLFVGNTQPTKGFPMLRRMSHLFPGIVWLLALRGEESAPIGLGPSVRIVHDVPRVRMPQFYASADFSFCSSLYDAFPYALPEGLACGLPIVSSLNGASDQFLRVAPLDNLLVNDASDEKRFADATSDVASRPEFYRDAVTRLARPAVEQWMDSDNFWKRFNDITGL
jgi:glycosyltransferase involved in cell wall biosynthesis